MSDQCLQYKEDYEKLLLLRQEFDAALEAGAKSRSFEETKRAKTELEIVLRNLEFDLKFKVWKTIELGTGLKTANDFVRALEDGGCEISLDAKSVLKNSKFTALSEKTKFELVIVSVADLGFPDGATRDKIYERAKEMGLELCPPEVGPQLRLQYKDRPMGEYLGIAMETVEDSDNNPSMFVIGHNDDNLWLDTYYDHPDHVCSPGDQWVFARRRPGDESPGLNS